MQWVVLAISLIIVVTIVCATVIPVRLALTFKGNGEFGKFWAFAVGGQLWFITVSYAAAQGMDSVLQVHLFSRRVLYISPAGKKVVDKVDEQGLAVEGLKDKTPRWRDRVERWFEFGDLLRFVVDLRHYVRMERFNGRLGYATPDVALTGVLSGSLYTIAGLMAPFGAFQIEPQWVDVAKAEGNLDVAFKFYPARVLSFAVIFTLKKIKLRQRTEPGAVPAQS